MYKKTVTYEDYNGNTRTESFYFNFSKAELITMEASKPGGYSSYLNRITEEQDIGKLVGIFKELLLGSYGEKSEDGRRFIKSKELTDAFEQNPAFSEIYMELATDSVAAAEFVKKVLPKLPSDTNDGSITVAPV